MTKTSFRSSCEGSRGLPSFRGRHESDHGATEGTCADEWPQLYHSKPTDSRCVASGPVSNSHILLMIAYPK